ncbi:hypothetical protein NDU88_007250 [Pleurodeles waltl]|uniref:Secreted protein n=1 Tax=Pleurodeles waltl TaxID=8319 RepID=A0AAV7U0Y0_PLEWA|nr:hypothetical protein NDU88_007250 [Pleurodeles waltl]
MDVDVWDVVPARLGRLLFLGVYLQSADLTVVASLFASQLPLFCQCDGLLWLHGRRTSPWVLRVLFQQCLLLSPFRQWRSALRGSCPDKQLGALRRKQEAGRLPDFLLEMRLLLSMCKRRASRFGCWCVPDAAAFHLFPYVAL